LVHGKYEYAALLAKRGHSDDASRLRELLHECIAGATEMGMTRVVAKTQEIAATAGITLD
jgi:hypothetical protein